MRILIVGHRGQLGSDLSRAFAGEKLTLVDKEEMPVQDRPRVADVIRMHRPELILNCSAFHRVDDCEDQADLAFDVNVFGVRNLALAARDVDATMVHFSTDYVFDGPEWKPRLETDYPSPKSVYAVSKLAGEFMLASLLRKHFIVRSSGLYGYAGSREKGTNFVETMIALAKRQQPIRVVNDQTLTPTSTADLAAAVRNLVGTECYGLYHLTNTGECTWYEFATAIFQFSGLTPELQPVTTDAFPMKAKRPSYSVLDNFRYRELGFPDMPGWRDALQRYVAGRVAAGRS